MKTAGELVYYSQATLYEIELSSFIHYHPAKHIIGHIGNGFYGSNIIGHIGNGFYGSNDPTNGVKALKEDRFLRIRLQSHQVHPTVLRQCSMTKNTNTKEWRHTKMGPQQDKTQSREL